MTTAGSTHRPGSVTTVVVLTILAGVLDLIAGATTLAFANNDKFQELTDTSTGVATTLGVISLIVGLVTIAVGLSLRSGSRGARMLVSILMAVRAIAAVWALIALGSHNAAESIGQLVMSALVLALLWNRKANEFFG